MLLLVLLLLLLLLLLVHDVKLVVVNDDISGIVGETESAEMAGLASIATENVHKIGF